MVNLTRRYRLPTGVLLILLGIAISACNKGKTGSSSALAPENLVASENAGAAFSHPHFQFGVSGLDNRWQILSPEQASGMLPDAEVMVLRVGGIYGAVIVEPIGDIDPTDYLNLLVSNISGGVISSEWTNVADVDHHGFDAREIEGDVEIDGSPLHYQIRAFIRDGYGFQLISWHLGSMAEGDRRGEFFDAVKPLDGAMSAPPVKALADFDGIGRRVRDGRFETPVYKIAATAPDGWKLMGEVDLMRNAEDAEIGLEHTALGAYITLTAEHITGKWREAYRNAWEDRIANSAEHLETDEDLSPITVDVGGRTISLRQSLVDGGLPLRRYHGLHFNGDLAYTIEAWHFEQRSGSLSDEIVRGLGGFSFLNDTEASRIEDELRSVRSVASQIGPSQSFRSGTFRDFEAGVVWNQPKGFWRVSTGDAARLINDAASLYASEVGHGLSMQLISEDPSDWDAESFHQAIVTDLASQEGFEAPESFPPIPVSGKPTQVSKFRQWINGMPLERFVVTTVRDQAAHQIHLWSWEDHPAGSAEMIGHCVAAFQFPEDAMMPTETDSNSYSDHRVGFGIKLPGSGWRIRQNIRPELSAFGGTVEFSRKGETIHAMGLVIADQQKSDAILGQLVEGILKVNFDRASESGISESKTTVDSADARVMSMKVDGAHGRILTFSHEGAFYLIIVMSPSDAGAEQLLGATRKGFKFLH